MSRSNPSNSVKNPATRWIEWNGEKGVFRYYDKESALEDKNIELNELTFLLLDRVGAVTGWSEAYKSGIYSNQVRSSKKEPLIVSAFNKSDGPIAEGIWTDIKDLVNTKGGKFTANIYAAMKIGGSLSIVCVQFKGAALNAWSEFEKNAGESIFKKAVKFSGSTEGKKGRVVFFTPKFTLVDVSPETDRAAVELDKQLQEYLKQALGKSTQSQEVQSEEEAPKKDAPASIDEKKKLGMSSSNFPTLIQNLVKKETTVADILAKYDVEERALEMLLTAEKNSDIDSIDEEEEDGDLPF